ncbi:MAG: hypothetical protein ABJD13_03130 [Paracoccaceae bacterium]
MNAKSDTPTLDALSKRAVSRGRYKFYSVLFGLGILCTIFAVLVLLPFKYEAHVDILVRVDRDASPVPQLGGPSADQIVVTGVRPEDVATEISILTGRQVAEVAYESLGPDFFLDEDELPENFRQRVIQVIKATLETVTDSVEATLIKLRMARESTPREDAISDIMSALNVSKSVRSDLISLGVRAGSPENARAILSAIATAYFEAHQDARAVFRGNDLFKDLQARTEAEMAELGRQIEQSKVDLNVFDFPLWIEQRTLQLASLQAEQSVVAREKAGLDRQITKVEADLTRIKDAPLDAEPLNSSELLSTFRGDLGRAVRDMQRDVVRFGRTSQQVQEGRAVIEALQGEIRQADIAHTQRLMRQFEREDILIDIKSDSITALISDIEGEIAKVSSKDASMRALETKRAALATSLAQVTDERTRSEWLAALDSSGPARITILDPITVSDNPVAPNKVVILIAGIVVSILGGVGLYIILTQMFVFPQQRRSTLFSLSMENDDQSDDQTGAQDLPANPIQKTLGRDAGR